MLYFIVDLWRGELRSDQLKSKQENQNDQDQHHDDDISNVNTFFPAQKSMRSSQINIKIPEN